MRIPNTKNTAYQLHHTNERRAVKLVTRNDDAAHSVAMPTKELRCAMDHHISPVFDRLTQIGRREGVIDNESRANFLSDFCARVKITDFEQWIGNSFRYQNSWFVFAGNRPQFVKITEISMDGFDIK